MRERVSTYGGTISAGREATGGFRVTARIPVVAE
jgi:signal transduction histidine kinase